MMTTANQVRAAFALLLIVCSGTPTLAQQPALPSLDLPAETVRGDTLRVDDLRGRVVLVDFWATWCPPCMRSLPHYQDLIATHGSDNLVVVAVSVDHDERAMRRFVEEQELDLTFVWDEGGVIAERFAPGVMPTAYLFDRTGAFVEVFPGFDARSAAALARAVGVMIDREVDEGSTTQPGAAPSTAPGSNAR